MERVADPADHATNIELEHNVDRVSAISRLVPKPEEMLKLHDECTDCGMDITPPERKAMGYDTCIFCAAKKEAAGGNRIQNRGVLAGR